MKKKILTILGTRPEIIRLSLIIPKLDKFTNHILVHTGQNYDYNLNKVFFKNFKIRKPNYFLGATGNFANQISIILKKLHNILIKEKPNRFLVLGDTNSSLGAIVAKRLGIPVFHMEAGNRQYDDVVPEEINRRIIDNCSDILLPYTQRSSENLVKEGFDRNKIFITGNPINEVIKNNYDNIVKSKVLDKLKLKKNNYFLVTLHRQENVDNIYKLKLLAKILKNISFKFKKDVVWPAHPRAVKNLKKYNISVGKRVKIIIPQGFFDFINLEINCACILTDSGTVQEEAAIFKIPNIILREKTERPETIESGSSIISMNSISDIINAVNYAIKEKNIPNDIHEYNYLNVSKTLMNIILSNYDFDKF